MIVVGRLLQFATYAFGLMLVLLVVLLMHEAGIYSTQTNQGRVHVLKQWIQSHPGTTLTVSDFHRRCIEGDGGTAKEPTKIVSVYDCTARIGGPGLVRRIKASDQSIPVPFPLNRLWHKENQ